MAEQHTVVSAYETHRRSSPTEHPSTTGLARIAEDARMYRKTVRANAAGTGFKLTPAHEVQLKHTHVTNRGLKVVKGDAPGYIEATHTFVHPTPEDKAAVVRDYFGLLPDRLKLARIKIGPVKSVGLLGDRVFHHHILDAETGEKLGHIELKQQKEGTHLHVAWVGAKNGDVGNVLGAEAMRTGLKSVARLYPKATTIGGNRASGFRKKAKPNETPEEKAEREKNREVVVPIKRLKLGRKKKEVPTASEHDQLIKAAQAGWIASEHTPSLVLADHKQELGLPGADLLRDHHDHVVRRGGSQVHQLEYSANGGHRVDIGKHLSVGVEFTPSGEFGSGDRTPVLSVTHWPDDPEQIHYHTHYNPVRSWRHFYTITKDLPKQDRHKLMRIIRTDRGVQNDRPAPVMPLTHPWDFEGENPLKLARPLDDKDSPFHDIDVKPLRPSAVPEIPASAMQPHVTREGELFNKMSSTERGNWTKRGEAWAMKVAAPHVDRFAVRAGYTDDGRVTAHKHLAQILLAAAVHHAKTGNERFHHTLANGHTIRVRVNPALAKKLKPKTVEYKPGMDVPKAAKLARKKDREPTDKSRIADFAALMRAVTHRPYVKRMEHHPEWGDREVVEKQAPDMTAHRVLADWLREVTNNTEDPRATVVENHVTHPSYPNHPSYEGQLHSVSLYHNLPKPVYPAKTVRKTGLSLEGVGPMPFGSLGMQPVKATHAIVGWRVAVPRTDEVGNKVGKVRRSDYHEFRARLEPEQLHALIDHLPEKHKKEWRDYATSVGLHDTRKPVKLARTQMNSEGSAQAMAGSNNHDQRVTIARRILKEAGLSPATVRAAIAHDGQANRPSVVQIIKREADPSHTKYAAAWRGLMLNEPAVAVFHPDADGQDFLHVIHAPQAPDQIAKTLRDAGVPRFVTEHVATGSRTYVLNPKGKYRIEQVAGSIPNARHSFTRGHSYRIGTGASPDAATGDDRADYRGVISSFEREAGVSPGGAAEKPRA